MVGGGFTGLVAAAALARRGTEVTLIEARRGPDPRFRGELIHPRGARVLAALGLREAMLAAGAVPVVGFAVATDTDATTLALPYPGPAGEEATGLAMDHRDMVSTLRREVSAMEGVSLELGTKVGDVLRERGRVVGVRLADGRELQASLVVVAEGRHSRLRGLLGLDETNELLSFTVAVLCEDTELPLEGHGHVFLGAPGPVLAYPIGGGRVRMCVDIPSSLDKDRKELAATLRARYAPFVPEPLRSSMLRALEAGELEVCGNHKIRVPRAVVDGAALVGDAAGCSHPLTASGMTVCANDVVALVEALGDEPTQADALLAYEEARTPFVRTREILTDALYEVFLAASPATHAMREGIFAYWRRSERARRASMALLSGDDVAVTHFAEEYVRVFGLAAYYAVVRQQGALLDRLSTLLALIRLTTEKVEASALAVAAAVAARGSLPPPAPAGAKRRTQVERTASARPSPAGIS